MKRKVLLELLDSLSKPLIILVIVLIIVSVYWIWNVVTAKVSASFDCEVTGIDYDNKSCWYDISEINKSSERLDCIKPTNIKCSGVIQNFPIIRAIIEANK